MISAWERYGEPLGWDPVYPEVGSLVIVGGERAVVVAHADQEELHPLIEDGPEEVVVAVRGESEPRAVTFDEACSPSEYALMRPICHPNWDYCQAYGHDCDTTGVVYFDVQEYGGTFYVTLTCDGASYTGYLEQDTTFTSERRAREYAVDAAIDHIYECWHYFRTEHSFDCEEAAEIDKDLEEQAQQLHRWAKQGGKQDDLA